MKANVNQKGIGHIAVVLGLLFVAVVGFAGYKVVSMNPSGTSVNSTAASSVVPQKITTKAELTQAGKALDSSSSDVNANLNDNALNADLNDML